MEAVEQGLKSFFSRLSLGPFRTQQNTFSHVLPNGPTSVHLPIFYIICDLWRKPLKKTIPTCAWQKEAMNKENICLRPLYILGKLQACALSKIL